MSKIIAVANQKGGVGKTTTAINLGASLGLKGRRVLLVDIDPQGNCTSGLGIDVSALERTVYDAIIGSAPIDTTIYETAYTNLFICPSNQQLAGAEIELVGMESREYRLREVLRSISSSFDYILIDCPPSISLLTLNSLVAADSVLMPIQCEYYALEGLSSLTNTIKQVRKALNPSLAVEGILLTMFDARTNLSAQVVSEVRKYFPEKTYKTVVPRNVRLSEAPSFGKPITVYDPSSKGCECYLALADEIISKEKGGRIHHGSQ